MEATTAEQRYTFVTDSPLHPKGLHVLAVRFTEDYFKEKEPQSALVSLVTESIAEFRLQSKVMPEGITATQKVYDLLCSPSSQPTEIYSLLFPLFQSHGFIRTFLGMPVVLMTKQSVDAMKGLIDQEIPEEIYDLDVFSLYAPAKSWQVLD